jgi:AraC-like DNA-binding protein
MFSLPMHELTSEALEARAVLGTAVDELAERLSENKSFEERARTADLFFTSRCSSLPDGDGLTRAALSILNRKGRVEIPMLAQKAQLSPRQFERRFSREIGLPPKLFARIARFEAALESKALSASESWTEITNRLGYYDQTHLIKDFKEFSGEVPTRLLAQLESAYAHHLSKLRSSRRSLAWENASRLIL